MIQLGFRDAPEQALPLLAQIKATERYVDAAHAVAKIWLHRDVTAATEWIRSSRLPEKDKALLLGE
jgi:hypothetical protein